MLSSNYSSSPASPGAFPDDLAAVVVRRLDRRSPARSWGLFKTIVLGVPSFGLLPLLAWPSRFREYVADESQALQELAQWAKPRGRQPAAVGPLLAAAEDSAASPLPLVLSVILSALVFGVFFIEFTHVDFTLDRLLDWTYCGNHRFSGYSPLSRQEFIYRVWVSALSIGYFVQWLSIRGHAADVERFVARFNPVSQAEMLSAVRFPRLGWACPGPLWIITAVVLARAGAWWGIPMVLAGIAQARYTNVTGLIIRAELARRVKDIVALRQSMTPPSPVIASRCHNPRCLAPLRPQARFCPRCGSIAVEGAFVREMYIILCVTGWVWTVVVFVFLSGMGILPMLKIFRSSSRRLGKMKA